MPIEPRSFAVNIRLTATERERIEVAAVAADRKLSDYIRQAALEAAKRGSKSRPKLPQD